MELPNTDSKSIENALFIEHHVARIMTEQENYGVVFNKRRAEVYVHVLERRQYRLYARIRPHLRMEVVVPYDKSIDKPFKADGDYSAVVKRWWDGSAAVNQVGGAFSRVRFEEPDLGKRQQLNEQLLKLGWVPREFTPTGQPKIKVDGEPCPSLEKIDSEIGQWISHWYTYRHRQSQIQGWIDNCRPDGRLPAGAFPIGTPTYRMRHRVVVNVPKAAKQVLFGWAMRSLFTVPKGKKMVGFDASGLELRMLADVINDEDFTKEVVDGDPHTKNQRDAGLPTRDDAKTFIYAFIYGAGDAKIGSIVGGTRNQGARIRRQFLASNPKLAEAIGTTKRAARRGYLFGLDGRKIHLRRDTNTGEIQDHKALNTRLQSGGAVVMKWAMVILDHWVRECGLEGEAKKVIDMHDEAQWEVEENHAHTIGQLGKQSIIMAGKMLGLNVPLDADYKVGTNWAMTH